MFGIRENAQIGEAEAWWSGRLDLPERKWDTAVYQGRVFSYFPPMFTILAAVVVPISQGIPHAFVVLLVLAVPLLAFVLFRRLTNSDLWGCVLAIGFACGTSFLPVSDKVIRGAPPYDVNHVLASLGVLIFLIDYFGKRRVWLAGLGLACTALSRQLTLVFCIPLVWMAWRVKPQAGRTPLVCAFVSIGAIVGLYGTLNFLKFGNPLHTGYMLNHEGREDVFAREARAHGLLSVAWVPRNLYHANVGLPNVHSIEIDGRRETYLTPNTMGTGIWWTTPLLLWIFFDLQETWRDPTRRVLFAAAILLFILLSFWHATGAVQRGYNRYSLDYLPVVLALIASRCIIPKRRWITLGMIAWSIFYFRAILPLPHVCIWSS